MSRHTLATLLCLGAALWLSWPTLASVLTLWLDDGTYSHGSLLLLTCAWLVWHEQRRQPWPPARPSWPALLPLVVVTALYVVASATDIDLLQRLLLLPVWLLVAMAVAGPARARRLLFPALLLSLALPLWGLLVNPLQHAAVAVVGTLLDWQQIPARIHATYIRIPAGDFEVAQGCSGLRYLLVAAAVTLLWARLYLRGTAVMLAYLAIGISAALVTNWIRIYLLILIGHKTDMTHALMQDHNNFGWYIFAVMLVPLFWIGRNLPHRPANDSGAGTDADAGAVQGHGATASPWPQAAAVLAVFAGALLLTHLPHDSHGQTLVLHPPLPTPPTQLVAPHGDSWKPAYAGLDRDWQLHYRAPARDFTLYLGWYSQQRNGAELGASSNRMATDGWLARLTPLPCPASARCLVVEKGARQRAVLYWHMANGRWVESRLGGKWQQLLSHLSGRPDAAILALSSDCQGDCSAAAADLWQLAKPAFDDVATQLQNRGDNHDD